MKSQNNPQNYMLGWGSALKGQDRRKKEQKGRILAITVCLHTGTVLGFMGAQLAPCPLNVMEESNRK